RERRGERDLAVGHDPHAAGQSGLHQGGLQLRSLLGAPAPAAATSARSTGRSTPPWAAARRPVSLSTAADAGAPPGFIAAGGPSARPRIVRSAVPITTVVWDPPASAPKKMSDGRIGRSEERRVGKECRCRGWREQ